jgi:LacI family transcriptional regulator
MQDIANKLGVSKGTVSLVLSGKAKDNRVSEAVSEKVKQTAREMNYRLNEVARSLRTGQTKSIGVIVTDISNEFFGLLTYYIQEQAKSYGYMVITTNTNENLEEFESMVTTMLNKKVDGFIIVPVDKGRHVAENIIRNRVPFVQIDRFYPELEANYVGLDNYKASVEGMERLLKTGCKRVALICYDINLNALSERREGYRDVLSRHGLLDPTLIRNIEYERQEESIKQAIMDIKNNPEKVDAIFFCSRRVFFTGIKYMYEMGIRIPDDIQVLCFDKIESYAMANIPFICIEQPIREMGEKAVDILMDRINGSEDIKQYKFDAKINFINT